MDKKLITEFHARQRIIQRIQALKSEMVLHQPLPYTGVNNPVAQYLGILVYEKELDFDEGMYLRSDQPRIVMDIKEADPERRNFTFYHEITHHLIHQDPELYSYLHEYALDDLESVIESFCNIGAAEFLVPSNDVMAIVAKEGFSIELISYLDVRYPASKPAIAIQLAQVAAHQCAIVVCAYGHIPSRYEAAALFDSLPNELPQIYVQYSACSPSFKYKIGRFVAIPREHIISNAYIENASLSGKGLIPFLSGTKWEVPCEAYFYKGKVYAVFNVTSSVPRGQLSLGL
jgi:Zn-dependent peptidase ImmA (M78 family)